MAPINILGSYKDWFLRKHWHQAVEYTVSSSKMAFKFVVHQKIILCFQTFDRMKVLSIFLLMAAVSLTTVSARSWNVGDNGLSRWDYNCHFQNVVGEEIGGIIKSSCPALLQE